MTTDWFGVVVLLMVAWLGLTSGCTATGAQYDQSTSSRAYIADVPPSFYGNDPTLEHWYSAPYWHPDAD